MALRAPGTRSLLVAPLARCDVPRLRTNGNDGKPRKKRQPLWESKTIMVIPSGDLMKGSLSILQPVNIDVLDF